MKKLVVLFAFLLSIQMPVFADITDVTYTYDEEYIQKLDTGLEYKGYSGALNFTVADNVEEVGFKLAFDDPYYLPFEIPFMGDLSTGNFSMRIGGRALESGNYVITPYYVKNGVKTYGNTIDFNISANCVAMTHLRIAYDQLNILIEKKIFTEEEQNIIDYIMPVAKKVIDDGETGVEITRKYIVEKYEKECNEVKNKYDNLKEKNAFLKKLEHPNLERNARAYLLATFIL